MAAGLVDSLKGLPDTSMMGAGASVGIGATAVLVLGTVARKAGQFLQVVARRHCLVSVEVTSKDHCYAWLLQWLAKHTRHRNHTTVATQFHQSDSGRIVTEFAFGPSPGSHLVWLRNWPMWLHRTRDTQSREFQTGLPFETLSLTTVAGRPGLFHGILRQAREEALIAHEGCTKLYVPRNVDWIPFGAPRLKRPLSSVVLRGGHKEQLLDDLTEFLQSSEWYQSRGIPYRRGYLLHGPPGTGKSSLIFSLAGELDFSICILSLNEQMFTEDRLAHLLVHAPHESIVLLEDIDCVFRSRDDTTPAPTQSRASHPGISLSGLLNALDGVAGSIGRLVFMTTNHPELLDPALLRPGRVDRSFYLGYLDTSQAENMFSNFYPDCDAMTREQFSNVFEKEKLDTSPAKLQGHFMQYKTSPQLAMDKLKDISIGNY